MNPNKIESNAKPDSACQDRIQYYLEDALVPVGERCFSGGLTLAIELSGVVKLAKLVRYASQILSSKRCGKVTNLCYSHAISSVYISEGNLLDNPLNSHVTSDAII